QRLDARWLRRTRLYQGAQAPRNTSASATGTYALDSTNAVAKLPRIALSGAALHLVLIPLTAFLQVSSVAPLQSTRLAAVAQQQGVGGGARQPAFARDGRLAVTVHGDMWIMSV